MSEKRTMRRYDFDPDIGMDPDPVGGWVRYADAVEQIKMLREALEKIRSEWALYRAYLEQRYPATPGEKWDFTCPHHKAIDAALEATK